MMKNTNKTITIGIILAHPPAWTFKGHNIRYPASFNMDLLAFIFINNGSKKALIKNLLLYFMHITELVRLYFRLGLKSTAVLQRMEEVACFCLKESTFGSKFAWYSRFWYIILWLVGGLFVLKLIIAIHYQFNVIADYFFNHR